MTRCGRRVRRAGVRKDAAKLPHIEAYAQPGNDGLVFVGPKGAPLRRPGFSRTWDKATSDTGLVGVHFHDLRHAGNTLAALSGANLRELMARMGHSTTRAALIHQHRAAGRDQLIADAMGSWPRLS